MITRFTQAVVRSRPLKKIGAEQVSRAAACVWFYADSQILLDVQAVKACLLDLPEPHPESGSNAYTKYVTKNTGQLETMLKVILAPDVSRLCAGTNTNEADLGRTRPRALCRTTVY